MSRWIEVDEEYRYIKETIANMDECRHLCNQVCCNDLCGQCGYWATEEDCGESCPHYEKEDGIITDR